LLWSRIVPVAFHVDYWDSLGWRDDFARPEFTQRQQRYARLRQASQVYTPGMFLDGREWRAWRDSSALSRREITAGEEVGQLTLEFDRQHSNVSFSPVSSLKKLPGRAHLALLGLQVDSMIKAGENKGRRLRHDFVVLELVSADLQRSAAGLTATLPPITTQLTAPSYAVAAWVAYDDDSKLLQATGGRLPN
jgi:hypothetical protein